MSFTERLQQIAPFNLRFPLHTQPNTPGPVTRYPTGYTTIVIELSKYVTDRDWDVVG